MRARGRKARSTPGPSGETTHPRLARLGPVAPRVPVGVRVPLHNDPRGRYDQGGRERVEGENVWLHGFLFTHTTESLKFYTRRQTTPCEPEGHRGVQAHRYGHVALGRPSWLGKGLLLKSPLVPHVEVFAGDHSGWPSLLGWGWGWGWGWGCRRRDGCVRARGLFRRRRGGVRPLRP